MANRDGVFSYQDVFHYKPYDPLAFIDTERISRTAQAGELEHASLLGAPTGCRVEDWRHIS
jgi:hypothetical protein